MSFPYPKSIAPGRCIVFLICLSLIVMLSASSPKPGVEPGVYHDVQLIHRQDPITPLVPSSTPVVQDPRPTSTSTEATPPQSSDTQINTPSSTPSAASNLTPTVTSTQNQGTPPQQTPSTPPEQISSIQSTGADGQPTIIVMTVQATGTSATPTPTSEGSPQESSGLGTGSIIGLSVAGGIALLGIVAFFIWKFTRKRRSATYDDGEIKWPDLNSENHISGHDDHPGAPSLSDGNSVRDQAFRGAYSDGGLGASQSQVDLYAADPYAVPPLPHLNPSQPYRDDPGAGPYHDNFGAPAFHENRPGSPGIRGEVIPMNQINRSRSPGPQAALYTGYGGRQSPGPQDAFGGGVGRRSPGPHDAYGPR